MEEIRNQMEPRRRKKLIMYKKGKCFRDSPTCQSMSFSISRIFLQKFKLLCLYCFRCDATLNSMDGRVQGGHLLIPFLAELQGRGSSGCWFNSNSMSYRIQKPLQTRQYVKVLINFTSNSYCLANVKLLIKFKLCEFYLL